MAGKEDFFGSDPPPGTRPRGLPRDEPSGFVWNANDMVLHLRKRLGRDSGRAIDLLVAFDQLRFEKNGDDLRTPFEVTGEWYVLGLKASFSGSFFQLQACEFQG
jgi:hypothetical protein